MLVVGPQHAAGGKRAVAVAEYERALFKQQRLGAVALGGNGGSGRLTGQASADDEDVGLLVPVDLADRLREVVLVLGLALGGASAQSAGGDAGQHSGAGGLDEVAARLRQVQTIGQFHLLVPFLVPASNAVLRTAEGWLFALVDGTSALLCRQARSARGALPYAAALLALPVRLTSIAEEDNLRRAAFLHPQLV